MIDNNLEFHRYANLFPMMTEEESNSLAANIRAHGLREKVWLFQGKILDGRNRYRACQKAGVEPRFQEFTGTEEEALQAVLSWNLERRHLNQGQKAMIALEVLPEFEAIAKAKQLATLKQNVQQSSVVVNLPQRGLEESLITPAPQSIHKPSPQPTSQSAPTPAPKSRDIVAAAVGTSPSNVQRAKKIQERRPDLAAKVRTGEITLNQANTEIRREERIEKIAEIAQGNRQLEVVADSPLAPEKFPVIYADPPWRYEHVKTDNRAIENQYPTMALDEICDLPVAGIATPDAILFLWTTSPKLAESLSVVDAWGFTYRTCAVWVKDRIGMGYYFRQQHELLLVCTRGSIPVPPVEARVSSVIHGDRLEHSAKPAVVAEIIEAMYPELPKVELFCRSPRPGWFVWGNQSHGA